MITQPLPPTNQIALSSPILILSILSPILATLCELHIYRLVTTKYTHPPNSTAKLHYSFLEVHFPQSNLVYLQMRCSLGKSIHFRSSPMKPSVTYQLVELFFFINSSKSRTISIPLHYDDNFNCNNGCYRPV